VLMEHPDVAEVLVMGIDHDDLGQEVAAVVVRRSTDVDAEVLEHQLREHAAGSLAYFKVPSHWRITDQALPRNATGKVVRARVQV
jgi:acyl-coenzyme A synthetase/AMP-(fatty) acid ligase